MIQFRKFMENCYTEDSDLLHFAHRDHLSRASRKNNPSEKKTHLGKHELQDADLLTLVSYTIFSLEVLGLWYIPLLTNPSPHCLTPRESRCDHSIFLQRRNGHRDMQLECDVVWTGASLACGPGATAPSLCQTRTSSQNYMGNRRKSSLLSLKIKQKYIANRDETKCRGLFGHNFLPVFSQKALCGPSDSYSFDIIFAAEMSPHHFCDAFLVRLRNRHIYWICKDWETEVKIKLLSMSILVPNWSTDA